MFNKKTRRNIRQRKNESSEEDESEKVVEDRNEIQSSKQSNLQRRGISCSSKPSATPPRESDSVGTEEPGRDSVTTKLQSKNTKTTPSANTLSFHDEKYSTDGFEFKLKRSANREVVFHARKKEDSSVEQGHAQAKKEELSDKREENSESAEDVLSQSDEDSKSSLSSVSSSSTSAKLQPISIPNKQKIQAAKAHRRRVRAQRDYIPLDHERENTPVTGEEEEGEEDDQEPPSDDEPDDHERRIQFAPRPKSLRERMAEKMGGSSSERSGSDSEGVEDQNLWEEQQIKKGVRRHHKKSSDIEKTIRPRKRFDIPKTLPPVSIDVIKRRITEKLDSLRGVHRAREAEHRRMLMEIDSSRGSMEGLEGSSADEQLGFYRSMSVFSQNFLECMSEKMPMINSLELDMHTLYIDQAEALLSGRREAVREESARLQQLTYMADPHSNGGTGERSDPTTDSMTDNSAQDWGSVPEDPEPIAEEEAELQQKREEILRRSQDVFVDVQEDFWDAKRILSRFNEWRVSFPESYNNAYIRLCLPKLLSPLIRYQLLGWNPLKADGEDFEELPWYSAVETFCHGQGFEESENADKKTLPAIIEKTILPKVQGFVELVWDPLSSRQSHCLSSLCERLQGDYAIFSGEQSKPVKAFVEAVTLRLRSAVDEDVFIPLYPKQFLDDRTSPQSRFQQQQFWAAVKLLGNVALWDGFVPQHVLMELTLDKLLNRYLMMSLLNETHLRTSIQKCKKVAECFPRSWFSEMLPGSSLPQLKNFSSHLLQMTHSVCKTCPEPSSRRELLTDLLALLWNIKAQDNIDVIVETYNCQELLESFVMS